MDFLDALFAPLFLLPGLSPADHTLGVGLLALLAAAISEATVVVLALANRQRVADLHDRLMMPPKDKGDISEQTVPTVDDVAPHDVNNADAAPSERETPTERELEITANPEVSSDTTTASQDANRAMAQAFLVRLVGTGGSLWPAFFVAGWLQGELGAMPLPVFDFETTYVPIFLAVYFVGRLVFQPVGSRVEALRTVRAQLAAITRLASQPPDHTA